MIDLDILAESRANKLGQDHEAWRKAVWKTSFHTLSQTLTDGEIESFFESCRTVRHFEVMTQYLMDGDAVSGITFSQLMDKVARSGYQMEEWVDSIFVVTEWIKADNRTVSFFKILLAINNCASKTAANASPLVEGVERELQNGLLDRN